jgi:CheY-like chemotaxis protein
LVDDNAAAREQIARFLERLDIAVDRAASGAQALEQIGAHPPDLLVSDIGVPGMDGLELIRRVRALPAGRGGAMPAIALTAFARSEERTRSLQAGFQLHVAKPVEEAELVAAVASLARLGPGLQAEPVPVASDGDGDSAA